MATKPDQTGSVLNRTARRGPSAGEEVLLVVGSAVPRTVRLAVGARVVVGRDANIDVRLDETGVSRRHAEFERSRDALVVRDLGSRNGTLVNGRAIDKAGAPIVGGDVVQIGAATLVVAVAKLGERAPAPADGASSRSRLGAGASRPTDVVVADPSMRKLFELVERVARMPTTVLILGETGVGKEVIAERVHGASPRAKQPYVRLNCAALSEALLESELFGYERGAFTGAQARKVGFIEAANGGTLFLDEVGEMPLTTQVKLLRVLENRTIVRLGATEEIPVDIRVVCATHRDLRAEIAAGRFREDLFYRISAFCIRVPPLRERPTELGLLATAFATRTATEAELPTVTFGPSFLATLRGYAWPGNIRELRNAIEHAVVTSGGGELDPAHLPEIVLTAPPPAASPAPSPDARAARAAPAGASLKEQLRATQEEIERKSLEAALAAENGNQTRAAARLGISRRALLYKMQRYGFGSTR
jgi:DNA-binding NtrC family response regulator